jgi:hypothetical protein
MAHDELRKISIENKFSRDDLHRKKFKKCFSIVVKLTVLFFLYLFRGRVRLDYISNICSSHRLVFPESNAHWHYGTGIANYACV